MKKNILLSLAAMLMSVALFAQDCSDLFISEYLEGSGNNKGVEVYNPTDQVISLSAYYIARYSNGKSSYVDGGITQLEGFIQPYGTHLLVNGQETSTETSPASDPNLRALAQQLDHDYPAPTYMNGNDAIALFKDLGGSGDENDFILLDLFGIIGGGMTSGDEGWASRTDVYFYKNIYDDSGNITGKDSAFISNYIVPEGYYFYRYDLWSANHSLVRKPSVKQGVKAENMPAVAFDITAEWDTVPGGIDVWDSLNAHYCDCEHGTVISENVIESKFNVYPNPAGEVVTVSHEVGISDISIYNMSGQTVFEEKNLEGVLVRRIDIEDINQGVYLLKVSVGDTIVSRKLIIQ